MVGIRHVVRQALQRTDPDIGATVLPGGVLLRDVSNRRAMCLIRSAGLGSPDMGFEQLLLLYRDHYHPLTGIKRSDNEKIDT